jgi:TRAP-type C4-dicarboxylate transport system, periplasmic component
MKTHLAVALTVGLVPCLVLAACASNDVRPDGERSADGERITVTVTTHAPETGNDAQGLIGYGKAVEEATDGRITFEYHFSESLVPLAETPQALADGVADLGHVIASYDPAKFPIANWEAALAIAQTPTIPAGLLAATTAQAKWVFEQPELLKEFEDVGVKVVAPAQTLLEYDILCKKPIRTLDEAKGTRIRVPGALMAQEAEALGMVPAQLPGGEAYEALQRGIVDCLTGPPEYFRASSAWDVAKHFTAIPLVGFNQYYVSFGLDFWNSLSDEDRTILADTAKDWYGSYFGGYVDQQLTFFREADDHGVSLHKADAELVAALRAHQEEVLANLAESAPSGVQDPRGTVQRRIELNEEYYQQFTKEFGYPAYQTWPEVERGMEPLDLSRWVNFISANVLPDAKS